jgi:hypothetical protein
METVKEDRSLATKTSHKAMSPAPSSLGKTAEEVSETQTALEEVRKWEIVLNSWITPRAGYSQNVVSVDIMWN